VGQGVVHDRHVHGADGAQVLGHDEVGVQVRQGTRVEAVEVLARAHPLGDDRVDLRRGQPRGHRRGRHDAA
jgi:hypothetical protein